jgi:hypothetical protein
MGDFRYVLFSSFVYPSSRLRTVVTHFLLFHRPGGKYGPAEAAKTSQITNVPSEQMAKAAGVVASALSSTQGGSGSSGEGGGLSLSSSLWTELLD